MEQELNEGERIVCDTCGKEYSTQYEECPYCKAERLSKQITKDGGYRSRGGMLAGMLLVIALIVGGVLIAMGSTQNGGWSLTRKYQVAETQTADEISSAITQQEFSVENTETPEPTEAAETETPTSES